ncbi:MAG: alanine racemase [Chloroflexi bacterium]|nr:alanine racemase [Chloroflexota bacterium]MDL1942945.1 alanine racemase [Chloroflexi bacterium CFX2]
MRPTYLEINLAQLKHNLEAIRAHVSPAKVMPMVKANAYGHGVDGVAPFIEPYVDYFGVAIVEEGIYLRNLGIKKPILVAGGTLIEQLPLFLEHDLTLTASSLDLLLAADQLAESTRKRMKVHLKFDTGMERVGVHEYEAEEFLQKSLACRHLEVEGIYTHLANSEKVDRKYSLLQLERFQEILRFYEKNSLPMPMRHVCNSGGILNLPEAHFDMVRPGVLFYGIYPGRGIERKVNAAPIAAWKSKVAYSKITLPGRPVSYGSLWQAEESPTRIVTIPCGYADGYFRNMTNRARVVIRGKSYPQVGRICMDQFMVNAGGDDIQVGDEAILLGGGITVEELADWAGTNEYEVMTSISARVPRVYVGAVQ